MGSSNSKHDPNNPPSDIIFPQACLLIYTKSKSVISWNLCDVNEQPICFVSLPQGGPGKLVVHSGLTKHAPPLAIAQYAGTWTTGSKLTLLPTTSDDQPLVEIMKFRGNGLHLAHNWAMQTAAGGLPEKFEWRSSKGEDVKSLGGMSYGWKLMRLKPGEEEVVAAFTLPKLSRSIWTAAKFQFLGSGATGELGTQWAKMTVLTFLRINQHNNHGSG